MNRNKITEKKFIHLLLQQPQFIDVRAPIEFIKGSLPNAINLPILNDEERALVGTIYKKEGNLSAMQLGYKIVSGLNKSDKINAWIEQINTFPDTVLYCFRGGQRSQIAQLWLRECGFDVPIIDGGYKKIRQFLMLCIADISRRRDFINLTGSTGSGKTKLIQNLKKDIPAIDLEKIARHRGSAFGSLVTSQPSQANFENELAFELTKLDRYSDSRQEFLIEDESRLIGTCAVPSELYDKYRIAPTVWVEEALEDRINNIYNEYVVDSAIGDFVNKKSDKQSAIFLFQRYKKAVASISRKLGSLRASEIIQLLDQAQDEFANYQQLKVNKKWIEKLIVYYYDPIYLENLRRREVKIIFKGSAQACIEFIRNRSIL